MLVTHNCLGHLSENETMFHVIYAKENSHHRSARYQRLHYLDYSRNNKSSPAIVWGFCNGIPNLSAINLEHLTVNRPQIL